MKAAELARWRAHREHCTARGTDNPCWGPDACQQCIDAAAAVQCTCVGFRGGLHSITCHRSAATQPHAMVDPEGDVYYPDDQEDADYFAREQGARPFNPERFPFTYQAPPDG